jgi:hypothetical protein
LKEHQNQKYREAKSDLRKEGVEAASKAAEAEARAIFIEDKISDTDVNHNNDKNNADGRHVVDGRRNNRGSSIRNSFSARATWSMKRLRMEGLIVLQISFGMSRMRTNLK